MSDDRTDQLRADQEAFAALIDRHDRDMMRVCAVITRNPHMARDAVQDAWQSAWRSRHSLRRRDRVWPWLLAIACNSARQQLRHRRRLEHHEADLAAVDQAVHDQTTDPDLQAALGRLSPRERELLALKFVVGLSSVDIAQVLRISPSGVRAAISRSVGQLRKELK